jgi:hypothetical protein
MESLLICKFNCTASSRFCWLDKALLQYFRTIFPEWESFNVEELPGSISIIQQHRGSLPGLPGHATTLDDSFW